MGLRKLKNFCGCCELKTGMILVGLLLVMVETTQVSIL
jgi:hypothetical protein